MDFLAPRQSVLQSSRGIDLPNLFGSLLAPPLPTACLDLAGLLGAVRAKRGEIAGGVSQVLFGSFDEDSDGYKNPLSFLFGPEPVCGAPHAKFTCYRARNEDVHFEVAGLREQPAGHARPQPLPQVGNSYGDAWLSALHLHTEPGINELQVTLAIGSHEELGAMILDLLSGVVSTLALVDSGCSDTEALGSAYRASFPHLAAHFSKFVDFEKGDITFEKVDEHASRFFFDFPLDYEAIERHYERLADLLRHFDRLALKAAHPDTGASLLEALLESDVLHGNMLVHDGKLCWEGSPCQPISFDEAGSFAFDLSVDCDVRLLGLSVAALPFPHLRLRCQLEHDLETRDSTLAVTCLEVGEVLLESIASFVFDVACFRELTLERFCLEISHRCVDDDDGGWIVAGFARVPFPVAGVMQLFAQYFQGFITRQMQDMHLLGACEDFFTALSLDATALSRGTRQPPRRDVRRSFELF